MIQRSKSLIYVGGFELPDKNAAAQRVTSNAKLFKSLDYECYFVGITKDIDHRSIDIDLETSKNKYSFPQKYPSSLKSWIKYLTDLTFIVDVIENKIAKRIDIIVAYNYPAFTLWRLNSYCKKNKIKLIADVTEWYQPKGNFFYKVIKGLDTYFRMYVLHKQLDGIISISSYLTLFYKNQNVIQLPPLVDIYSEKWKKKSGEKVVPKERVFCYFGSPGIGGKDKLDIIIQALSNVRLSCSNFKLHIIGITNDEYCNLFNTFGVPNNMADHVDFKGRLGHKDTISFLQKSDYSIIFRERNRVTTAGFPTKFVESISAGIPVLSNKTSNIDDYLIPGKFGFILDDSTMSSLTESFLQAILVDDKSLEQMKANCRKTKIFHYESYNNPLAKFLDSLYLEQKK